MADIARRDREMAEADTSGRSEEKMELKFPKTGQQSRSRNQKRRLLF